MKFLSKKNPLEEHADMCYASDTYIAAVPHLLCCQRLCCSPLWLLMAAGWTDLLTSLMVQRNAGVPQHHHGTAKAQHCTRLAQAGRVRREAGEEGFQPGGSAGGGSQTRKLKPRQNQPQSHFTWSQQCFNQLSSSAQYLIPSGWNEVLSALKLNKNDEFLVLGLAVWHHSGQWHLLTTQNLAFQYAEAEHLTFQTCNWPHAFSS